MTATDLKGRLNSIDVMDMTVEQKLHLYLDVAYSAVTELEKLEGTVQTVQEAVTTRCKDCGIALDVHSQGVLKGGPYGTELQKQHCMERYGMPDMPVCPSYPFGRK